MICIFNDSFLFIEDMIKEGAVRTPLLDILINLEHNLLIFRNKINVRNIILNRKRGLTSV